MPNIIKTWLNWSLSERQFRRKPAKIFSLSKRICLRIHLNLRQHEPISSRYVNYALMITISQHHHYHLPKNVVSCSGFDKHPLSRNRVGRALFSCGNFCQIIRNNSVQYSAVRPNYRLRPTACRPSLHLRDSPPDISLWQSPLPSSSSS